MITGIGVVAPTGIGTDAHWQAVLRGKSGIGRITRFDPASYPVRLAGQVPGFVARDHVSGRLLPQMDVWTHMSIAAADAALADADVNPAARPEYDMAVVTASSSGGTEFGQQEMVRLYQEGPSRVGAYQSIAWFYAATTGQLAIRYGMRGPCGVVCNEQAGGLDSLGHARRLIRSGTGLVVAGGLDASLCPYGLTAQLTNGRISTVDDPDGAYVPFDASASGYLPGEGGAILIVEDEEALGDRIPYGRIAGYASGIDPAPGRGRPRALGRVIRGALADAGIAPRDVDVVFADAMGTPEDDRDEAAALAEVFGARGVPVTAPKTLTGRLYAGGGALDVATALLAMRHNVLPHTTATTQLAPGCEIDLVLGDPRQRRLHTAVVVVRGHGGFTAAVVLQRD
ncbi:ketosynthase chain-length factor [Actinoplanes siamensis]|uniref:ketosynthase chain-length factor n=1 Tax=Actinoplanes siamensis TaxID=1223317 RepID=UPI0027DAC8CF|nr:ketosynthase chain-length factor [Actinoplanes siamensis]